MAEELENTTNEKDDEISLLDLFSVLLRRKWMIIIITALAMIGVVIYSVISLKLPPEKSYLPNSYKVSANMLITDSDSSSGLSLSGSASSLASLMGVNLGGSGSSSTSSLILYLTKSNPFYDAIAERFDLYEKFQFEQSPVMRSLKRFPQNMTPPAESLLSHLKTLTRNFLSRWLTLSWTGFPTSWMSLE